MATQFSQSSSSSLVENQNWPDEINSNMHLPARITHPSSQPVTQPRPIYFKSHIKNWGKNLPRIVEGWQDRKNWNQLKCRTLSWIIAILSELPCLRSDHFRVLCPLQPASHAVWFDIANRPFPVLMLVCRKLTLLSQSAIAANQFLSPFSNVLPRIDYPESHPSSWV